MATIIHLASRKKNPINKIRDDILVIRKCSNSLRSSVVGLLVDYYEQIRHRLFKTFIKRDRDLNNDCRSDRPQKGEGRPLSNVSKKYDHF